LPEDEEKNCREKLTEDKNLGTRRSPEKTENHNQPHKKKQWVARLPGAPAAQTKSEKGRKLDSWSDETAGAPE